MLGSKARTLRQIVAPKHLKHEICNDLGLFGDQISQVECRFGTKFYPKHELVLQSGELEAVMTLIAAGLTQNQAPT